MPAALLPSDICFREPAKLTQPNKAQSSAPRYQKAFTPLWLAQQPLLLASLSTSERQRPVHNNTVNYLKLFRQER